MFGALAALPLVTACGEGPSPARTGLTGGSGGDDVGFLSGSGGGAVACGSRLDALARDFEVAHIDFEQFILGDDRGMVLPELGVDGKPVYAGAPDTPTTNGKEAFDQWFRDTPGVNIPIPVSLTLEPDEDGTFTYDNPAFFPIDDQGWGNTNSYPHNYHFTLELHTEFEYRGGEVFEFSGDDDLFTFINGRLALDLGGVHGEETAQVDLDASAADLGLVVGGTYALDFFFAERQTKGSNFHIHTTISCFAPVPTPK